MDGFGPLVDAEWLAIRHAGLGDGRLFVDHGPLATA